MKAWSDFERQIENTNQFYLRKGFGVVAKIPNGTKTVRVRGQPPRIVASNKTGCDFIGFLNKIPIAFDAKSTSSKTAYQIYGCGDKKMLKPHQEEFLTTFKRNGGNAYVFIRFNFTDEVFLVDIDKYVELEKKALKMGKKSFPKAWLSAFVVDRNGYFYDYIKNIEQKEGEHCND